MCGILGLIGKTDREQFIFALERLAHRGPDGQGLWQDDSILLGNRRLAVIELSEKAQQPLIAHDRYVITYNGELFNFVELRKELEILGAVFTGNSDAEVVLLAYVQWGKECLKRFNGMWAFAIWDKQKKELFLSRDQLGKKPLFYRNASDRFIFASEMKGIYPFLDRIDIDQETVSKALVNNFSYEGGERCLVKGISRFPAGSYGIFKDGKLKIERYWNLIDNLVPVPSTYEEQCERFRELLIDSCRLRMRSDIPLASALSGGLDSTVILCCMQLIDGAKKNEERLNHNWKNAFVASFPGTAIDETVYAKEIEQLMGLKTSYITIDPLKTIDTIFKDVYMFEEIYYAPVIPFSQLYSAMKRSGFSVSIDGHGGDELFGGYPFDMIYALPDSFPKIRECRKLIEAINNTSADKNNSLLNQLRFILRTKYGSKPAYKNLGYFNSQLYQTATATILPTILRNYDRYSMMNGVEIRMPFLDHRIVEFAFSIPYTSKIRNGRSKSIVRDAFKDMLPQKIMQRKEKIGFNAPLNSWITGSMKGWILDEMNSQAFRNSSLIDPVKVKNILSTAVNRSDLTFQEGVNYFNLLVPYIWERSIEYARTQVKKIVS